MKTVLSFVITIIYVQMYAQDFKLVVKENPAGIIMLDYGGPGYGDNRENVLFGKDAGLNITNSNPGGNTFIGRMAGKANTSGQRNTFLGKSAGQNAIGKNNILVGERTGENLVGDNNTFIGNNAGFDSDGNNNLFLGYYTGYGQKGSHQLAVETQINSDSTEMLIYGQFDNDMLRFNAQTNIFTNNTAQHGLYVEKTVGITNDMAAINGTNILTDYYGIGVIGDGGYVGVQGNSSGVGNGNYYGVAGNSKGENIGTNYGIYGGAFDGVTNYGIYGDVASGANNYAGFFNGKVKLTDTLVVSDKGIEIEEDKIIKKATSMKYYIATNGIYPNFNGPGGLPSPDTQVGEIKLFAYKSTLGTPTGWQECDGSLLLIEHYVALFALLGTDYGGDGMTTFGVPDMREAVPYHAP